MACYTARREVRRCVWGIQLFSRSQDAATRQTRQTKHRRKRRGSPPHDNLGCLSLPCTTLTRDHDARIGPFSFHRAVRCIGQRKNVRCTFIHLNRGERCVSRHGAGTPSRTLTAQKAAVAGLLARQPCTKCRPPSTTLPLTIIVRALQDMQGRAGWWTVDGWTGR